jgi:hypothetical protein
MTQSQEGKLGLSCSNKDNLWRTHKRAKRVIGVITQTTLETTYDALAREQIGSIV